MFHITSRAYESCFAFRTLISNWIDRRFGQHLWNSVHSFSRDIPRIPTNPLSGSQQPPLLWGQWIRTKSCSKLTRAGHAWFKLQLLFSSVVHEGVFCWRYNSVPLIRRLSASAYTNLVPNFLREKPWGRGCAYTTCLFVTHINWLFCAHIYARL